MALRDRAASVAGIGRKATDDSFIAFALKGDKTNVTRCLRSGTYPMWRVSPSRAVMVVACADLDLDLTLTLRCVVSSSSCRRRHCTGIDPNTCDERLRTALHYACENNHDKVVRVLLDKNADPAFADRNGRTPLHFAAAGTPRLASPRLARAP